MNHGKTPVNGIDEYRAKVRGCWMGKSIGGTLGGPKELEWHRQVNHVEFYTQELGGEPLPNDDLDLQLIWLVALEENGIDIDARLLADYWMLYITPHWSEYGMCKVNMRMGLVPPLCGIHENSYKDSCGAFIRSEIWACIAPGMPETAVRYAIEDAIVDHGDGEGTYAEVFCAAVQSAAFTETDPAVLIDLGLSFLPRECGVAKAVRRAVACHADGLTWQEARECILAEYRGHYCEYAGISQEERDKGYADGPMGWDAPSNIAIIIIGWLYGEGDFGRSLCIAVNCGEDTDCTAGTLGAILGICHGYDALPERWRTPVGDGIKTACLNLGELGFYGDQLPADIQELSSRVEKIARKVLPANGHFDDEADVLPVKALACSEHESLYLALDKPRYRFPHFEVLVEYESGPILRDENRIILHVKNKNKIPETATVRWYFPENWPTSSAPVTKALFKPGVSELSYTFPAPESPDGISRFVCEICLDAKCSVMTVPVTLITVAHS